MNESQNLGKEIRKSIFSSWISGFLIFQILIIHSMSYAMTWKVEQRILVSMVNSCSTFQSWATRGWWCTKGKGKVNRSLSLPFPFGTPSSGRNLFKERLWNAFWDLCFFSWRSRALSRRDSGFPKILYFQRPLSFLIIRAYGLWKQDLFRKSSLSYSTHFSRRLGSWESISLSSSNSTSSSRVWMSAYRKELLWIRESC